jgi:hypothetical protein
VLLLPQRLLQAARWFNTNPQPTSQQKLKTAGHCLGDQATGTNTT